MAYSKAKLKSNGDRASPSFKPFLIRNVSDKFLPTRTLLYVSVRHIFISLTSFLGIPNSVRIPCSVSSVKCEKAHVYFQSFSQKYSQSENLGTTNVQTC